MMIQLQLGELANRFGDRRAHGEIGDKVSVHDVHVDHLDPGLLDPPDVFAQPCKISRENGWNELKHRCSSSNLRPRLPTGAHSSQRTHHTPTPCLPAPRNTLIVTCTTSWAIKRLQPNLPVGRYHSCRFFPSRYTATHATDSPHPGSGRFLRALSENDALRSPVRGEVPVRSDPASCCEPGVHHPRYRSF